MTAGLDSGFLLIEAWLVENMEIDQMYATDSELRSPMKETLSNGGQILPTCLITKKFSFAHPTSRAKHKRVEVMETKALFKM